MATFYIQLQDKLLQISGELTAENISKALGYVPVSPNVTNELSQRVDNITFDSLKDNPFLQDGSGELNIVDESGNIIAKIDADGIHSVDFIAGEHRLSNKTDKTYVDEAVKNVKVDLTGYATEEYVNNIDFYNINNNPIVDGEENSLTLVDEAGNIGLKVTEDGLYIKDVIANGHMLSSKADKSELPTKTSDLTNDSGYITIDDIPEVNIPSLDEYVKSEDLPNFDEFAKTEDIPEIPSLDGYATEQWVNNKNYATEYDLKTIDYSSINNVPVSEDGTGELNIADESGNIGMKVASEAVYAKDFIAGEHKLSEKVDKTYIDDLDEIRAGATKGATALQEENLKTINGESIVGSGDITISGGSSDANVMAIDTGDIIDDVNVEYATKAYVDGLVGDINSVLEEIINS